MFKDKGAAHPKLLYACYHGDKRGLFSLDPVDTIALRHQTTTCGWRYCALKFCRRMRSEGLLIDEAGRSLQPVTQRRLPTTAGLRRIMQTW
jgi:hypothetical protein